MDIEYLGETVPIETMELLRLVGVANDMGHQGARLRDIIYQPSRTASVRDSFLLLFDNGPKSSAESW